MDVTIHYYDVVLAAIIATLIVAVAVGFLTPVPMPVAIVTIGAVTVALVLHALFINGPVEKVSDLTEEVEDLPGVD